jgi:hypothetical protein
MGWVIHSLQPAQRSAVQLVSRQRLDKETVHGHMVLAWRQQQQE